MNQRFVTGNKAFLCFLLYIVFTCLTEWVLFLLYAAGITAPDGVAECIGLVLTAVVFLRCRGRIQPEKSRLDCWAILGLVALFGLGILISV